MMFGFILIAILIVAIVWFILDRREQSRVAAGKPRHSGLRLIFAAVAALTILFSGGCGALFLGSWIMNGMKSNDYVGWEIIGVLSLPPLLVGILIWWLSMRRAKG